MTWQYVHDHNQMASRNDELSLAEVVFMLFRQVTSLESSCDSPLLSLMSSAFLVALYPGDPASGEPFYARHTRPSAPRARTIRGCAAAFNRVGFLMFALRNSVDAFRTLVELMSVQWSSHLRDDGQFGQKSPFHYLN